MVYLLLTNVYFKCAYVKHTETIWVCHGGNPGRSVNFLITLEMARLIGVLALQCVKSSGFPKDTFFPLAPVRFVCLCLCVRVCGGGKGGGVPVLTWGTRIIRYIYTYTLISFISLQEFVNIVRKGINKIKELGKYILWEYANSNSYLLCTILKSMLSFYLWKLQKNVNKQAYDYVNMIYNTTAGQGYEISSIFLILFAESFEHIADSMDKVSRDTRGVFKIQRNTVV